MIGFLSHCLRIPILLKVFLKSRPFKDNLNIPPVSLSRLSRLAARSSRSIMSATASQTNGSSSSSSSSGPRQIAIVGGGIMGASTLYYLSKHASLPKGSSLTLIEAASTLAPGASGKAGGFLAEDWHGMATASVASLSFRLHRELAEEFGGDKKWGYREVETLSLEYDTSKTRNKGPQELHWVDGKHVSRVSNMGGAGTTAQATPKPLVEFLAAQAQEEAAKRDVKCQVLLNSYVKKVAMSGGDSAKVTGLTIEKSGKDEEEDLQATDVVLAAGPWMGSLIRSVFSRKQIAEKTFLGSASGITGSRAHSIILQPAKGATNHCLFTEMKYGPGGRRAGAPEVYSRGDTVYVCGGSDDVPLPKLAEEVSPDLSKTAELIEQSSVLSPHSLSPKEAGAKIIAEQACYLPIPGKGVMVLNGDAQSGIWVAGGGASCWGITLSLGVGKVMSDLILTGKTEEADVGMLKG